MSGTSSLAEHLRGLRTSANLTQRGLGEILGVSVSLISAWESGTIPPERRLDAYARLFADFPNGPLRLTDLDRSDADNSPGYDSLRLTLFALQAPPAGEGPPSPLRFPPGQRITVVCSTLPEHKLRAFGNVDVSDADHIDAYRLADLDALLALLPAIGAENPQSRIIVGTADELSPDDRAEHLISLGGVDWNPVTAALLSHIPDLPIRQLERDLDQDTGGFLVDDGGAARQLFPRVEPHGDWASLIEDVAHFLRAPNPFNSDRTLTVFNGMYSKGTHGIVRSLTDPHVRDRNAAHMAKRLAGRDTYSIVCRVQVVARQVVVPDWTQPGHCLHEWAANSGL
ncbi:helix-turn-helix domain-containing protein [Actinoplanes sp. NPDC049265]|uniref:helix-turn-helix domain-containing protein n=1 Tax=Actinoplanes sp. NPDC049265 TaxID=3363902 RepID=UPI00371D8596